MQILCILFLSSVFDLSKVIKIQLLMELLLYFFFNEGGIFLFVNLKMWSNN